jgi:hypothetical protein
MEEAGMKWTSKHPNKPGFYWYRDKHRAVVLEVRESFAKGKMLVWDWQQGQLGQYDIAPYPGEWYGPLKEPK